MAKVLAFLKPYRIAVAIALSLMLTELAVELIQPLLMAKIIDEGILQNDLQEILKWGGIMLAASFAAFAAGVINSFYAAHVSQSFGFDVRKSLYDKVQSFSFANFNLFPTSSLITRMTNDITQLQNTVFMSLRIMMRAPLLIIGGLIMAFVVDVKLALILSAVAPFLFLFLFWVMGKGGALFKAVQEKLDSVNSVMQENLTGIRLIKAFVRRNHEVKRFARTNEDLRDGTVKALRLMEVTMPVLLFIMNLSILGVLWFGSIQVNAGDVKVGEVVAIVNYATRITAAFSIFSWIIMAFSRARASANRVTEVLDTEVDLTDSQESHDRKGLTVSRGEIHFKDVSFKYPGTSEKVLDGISFIIHPGETVAIMGATGSGKTSLFQLIPRLYDVTGGRVEIDGRDVRELKMENLRRKIGFVPQEALLFTGSVKENISWGKEDAAMEEITEAAVNAQIHETIMKLPQGYETRVGQKGVNLSGGQKQRLSIARALVRKPKILLLDDSTSALDMKTEAKLLNSLKQYTCTTMIITQKISTAMEADRILLLEDGVLLAEGDHETLLKTSGLYKRIFQSQSGEENRNYA
ncbi:MULTISPECIES: ABC transporter ATP-binding protein [Bacillaceae]|uniref:ABC transporter ATP-binding protein/permease n=1 Tax=Cytobacillus firmus TaxID=1399 RepID=A0AA46Q0N1_CYTFI|nr:MULTISPECIES: ABC transporter ATP-binding protein [Bacillaceae]KML36153.1 ABC transporter ATP-binding protein [Cytobacillus firmus]MCC3649434.1 ABC transporter ATP-binding protein [Cytobacillus oceanisediminis]UYG97075.1 ABC transporter ATP-binding protein/permease [Cytobacillus firmus]WHY35219.1 ABC transporter ATP-binding protein [Cytobacillus firmus]